MIVNITSRAFVSTLVQPLWLVPFKYPTFYCLQKADLRSIDIDKVI